MGQESRAVASSMQRIYLESWERGPPPERSDRVGALCAPTQPGSGQRCRPVGRRSLGRSSRGRARTGFAGGSTSAPSFWVPEAAGYRIDGDRPGSQEAGRGSAGCGNRSGHGAFFFAAVFRTTSLLVSVASLPRPVFSMVTHGQVMFVLLELVAKFMFEERPHTALVPLLQTCTTFGVWHTVLQSHLDNTLRAVHRLGGAWRVGSSRVLLHVRVGARARLAVRRGHRQNFDVRLMAAIGYILGALVDTMELPGTTCRLARTARAFPTARGKFLGRNSSSVASWMFTGIATWITRFVPESVSAPTWWTVI